VTRISSPRIDWQRLVKVDWFSSKQKMTERSRSRRDVYEGNVIY
jgi:hypothetical protein